VRLLLASNGAEPDSKDNFGRTPLSWAAQKGNEAVVKLLLATNRVAVDSKNHYNSTPLSIATRMGHKDVVMFLLTKNPDLNSKDNFGRTPLWWARMAGYPYIADLLLENSKANGIRIHEDDLPTTTITVPDNERSGYCDVCLLNISENDDTYYTCRVCNDGNFWICKERFAIKAHCLDDSHTLVSKQSKSVI
jgi:ankyrin repeat protein